MMAAEVEESYATAERSDEEISVGCPSPAPRSCSSEEEEHENDDYFRPLKRLKMLEIDQVSYSIGKGKTKKIRPRRNSSPGLKSFSILDILSHRGQSKEKDDETLVSSTRIVRPWDEVPRVLPPPLLYRLPPHPELYETCSSGRSSASDCTSPDIINCTLPRQQTQRKSPNSSPLDALFQMTSKTFDELNAEQSQENGGNGLMFSSRQQPKKKRKSRTAFTNHQIFELEKRFLYQKYLSPADRDEIAAQLGLTNAQVITWFQNRRAKLKRDMEELKKDVETAKAFTQHKNFLENVQNFSILKKKPSGSSEDDKPSSPISEK